MRPPRNAASRSIQTAKPTAGIAIGAAQPREQPVIASARDQRAVVACGRIVQLEHEAGVIVEAAAEGGGEPDAGDVDAARGEKAGAALEQIERGIERDLASRAKARSSAAASSGSPLMARNFSISARVSRGSDVCAPSAACSRKRSAISPTERPPTAVMPAIESRSVTSACAALGSEPASAASTPWYSAPVRAADAEPFEIVLERGLVIEVLDQAPLPGRCQIERGDQRGEQPDVADADVGLARVRIGRWRPGRARASRRPPPPCPGGRRIRCRPAGTRPALLA